MSISVTFLSLLFRTEQLSSMRSQFSLDSLTVRGRCSARLQLSLRLWPQKGGVPPPGLAGLIRAMEPLNNF